MNQDLQRFLTRDPANYRHKLWYLAAPYSHPDPAVVEERIQITSKVAARITTGYDGDITVFAPTVYTSQLAKSGANPPDGWYTFTLRFLTFCDELVVLKLDGWEDSTGIQLEIATANALKKPVELYSPEYFLES